MDLKLRTKREGGFTLIELIAVIIILGILAAVIVPKYFDMTGAAKDAAYKGALSEAGARFNMAYSQYVMTTQTVPTTLAVLQTSTYLGGANPVSIGDYQVNYTGGGSNGTLTITLLSGSGGALEFNNGSNTETKVAWPN